MWKLLGSSSDDPVHHTPAYHLLTDIAVVDSRGCGEKDAVVSEATADEFLTTVQAAKYLKLSRQYLEIARHRADRSGPEFIKLTRAVRYRRSALDAWMDSHKRSGDERSTPAPVAIAE
jgi:predicted DNA-binding transcriptional regulator AlpA